MNSIIGTTDKFEQETDIKYHPDSGMLNYLKKSNYENINHFVLLLNYEIFLLLCQQNVNFNLK